MQEIVSLFDKRKRIHEQPSSQRIVSLIIFLFTLLHCPYPIKLHSCSFCECALCRRTIRRRLVSKRELRWPIKIDVKLIENWYFFFFCFYLWKIMTKGNFQYSWHKSLAFLNCCAYLFVHDSRLFCFSFAICTLICTSFYIHLMR